MRLKDEQIKDIKRYHYDPSKIKYIYNKILNNIPRTEEEAYYIAYCLLSMSLDEVPNNVEIEIENNSNEKYIKTGGGRATLHGKNNTPHITLYSIDPLIYGNKQQFVSSAKTIGHEPDHIRQELLMESRLLNIKKLIITLEYILMNSDNKYYYDNHDDFCIEQFANQASTEVISEFYRRYLNIDLPHNYGFLDYQLISNNDDYNHNPIRIINNLLIKMKKCNKTQYDYYRDISNLSILLPDIMGAIYTPEYYENIKSRANYLEEIILLNLLKEIATIQSQGNSSNNNKKRH